MIEVDGLGSWVGASSGSWRDAWTLWLDGESTVQSELWGLSILWWGRIGRIAEFVAALAIIAEVVGPERLRAVGGWLDAQLSLSSIWKSARDGAVFCWELAAFLFTDEGKGRPEPKATGAVKVFAGLYVIAGLIYLAFQFVSEWRADTPWWQMPLIVLGWYFIAIPAAPVVIFAAMLAASVIGITVKAVLIAPTAWALNRPGPDKVIKAASAVLLVGGFHFDLLAT